MPKCDNGSVVAARDFFLFFAFRAAPVTGKPIGDSMKLRMLCVMSVVMTALGCGDSGNVPQDFLDNMPNGSTAALDENPSDPSIGQASPMMSPFQQDAQAVSDPTCHPHLFIRTREVVKALNHYVIGKFFRRIDALIDNHATKATTSAVTWIKTVDNGAAQLRITLTKSAPGNYSLLVEAKAPPSAPDSAYVTVQTATVTNATGQAHQGSGTMHLDLTALGTVITTEMARGTIDLNYIINGNNKKVQVTLTNFTGDDANVTPPSNSNFVYARTTGVGGSFKLVHKAIFPCPSNPNSLKADLKAVHRWKKTSGADGGPAVFVGRSDAQATGGQLGQGQIFVGVTCADESATTGTLATESAAERFWQLAVFQGGGDPAIAGGTLWQGWNDGTSPYGTSTCDPSFGTAPSGPPNYRSNYTFTNINFSDNSVVPFPGMPTVFP
jgi:hypothetical protein